MHYFPIVDRDPGDEHQEPWPFYTSGEPFEMPASDDLAIMWVGKVPEPAADHDGWHTAVVEIDRSTGTFAVVHLDGRVEDITPAIQELNRSRR